MKDQPANGRLFWLRLLLRKIFPNIFPDHIVDDITEIDDKMLDGVRLVLTDWSGTLAATLLELPSLERRRWLAKAKQEYGLQITIVSDLIFSANQGLIKGFCQSLDYSSIFGRPLFRLKIFGWPFREAIREFGQDIDLSQIVVIDDGRLRGIWSANRLGLRTIRITQPMVGCHWLKYARWLFGYWGKRSVFRLPPAKPSD